MPLTVYELFERVDAANAAAAEAAPGTTVTTYTVKLAMLEIYNEVGLKHSQYRGHSTHTLHIHAPNQSGCLGL